MTEFRPVAYYSAVTDRSCKVLGWIVKLADGSSFFTQSKAPNGGPMFWTSSLKDDSISTVDAS